MQTRIFDKVLSYRAADGGDITDVFHHGRERDRHNRDNGRHDHTPIGISVCEYG